MGIGLSMSKQSKTIKLGKYEVGEGFPPLFLPDIGTFFNQDIAKAEKMIRGLHQAGVMVVKGEILQSADIALDIDYMENYLGHENEKITENYRKLIERKVVSLEDYARLFELCSSLDMSIIVSVYDEEGVDFALQHNVIALKVASSNITHRPLIEYICRQPIPIILDTGKASFTEISQAVEWLEEFGKQDYILQHSPKAPPAPIEEHNMRFLSTLRLAYQKPVGLSDHHSGNEMLMVATVLGASILEKGLYLDGDPADQGTKHAIALSEVSDVLNTVRVIYHSLGNGKPSFNVTPHPARMGVVACTDIHEGEVLTREHVRFAFPERGIGVESWHEIVGKKVSTFVKAHTPIKPHDLTD